MSGGPTQTGGTQTATDSGSATAATQTSTEGTATATATATVTATATDTGEQSEAFDFIVFGDFNGGGCVRNDRVSRIVQTMAGEDVDFYVSTGDIIDGNDQSSCFASLPPDGCADGEAQGNMRDLMQPIFDKPKQANLPSVFFPVIGNHDDNWGSGWYPDPCSGGICGFLEPLELGANLDELVNHPHGDLCSLNQDSSGHGGDFYYSFAHKGSYFIVLRQNDDNYTMLSSCNGPPQGWDSCGEYCSDPTLVDDPQRNDACWGGIEQWDWLVEELTAAKGSYDNIFVFAHAVLMGNGSNHGPMAEAPRLRTLLEDSGVRVFFNGHNHAYQRSVAIRGGKADSTGTTYITTGVAGASVDTNEIDPLYAGSYHDWVQWGDSNFEERMATYMKVSVTAQGIEASVYSLGQDEIVDTFSVPAK